MKTIKLNCRQPGSKTSNMMGAGQLFARLVHYDSDPENVNRLIMDNHGLQIELLPSKGMSIGQGWFENKPVFWEPPIGMPDPDTLGLKSDEIAINGIPAPGFTFLKTFNGGVELYGLKNWGMPRNKNGVIQPLHGETSNIPLQEISITINKNEKMIGAKGVFIYKSMTGDSNQPWYLRGYNLVKVIRNVILKHSSSPVIKIIDSFENISPSSLFIDWGYHITFAPETGGKIIIPSQSAENRGGGKLPKDIGSWHPAHDPKIRTETGIIHKNLKKFTETGKELNKALVQRPTLGSLLVSFKPAPYMQTWMCNGGADNTEFTLSKTGKPLFQKNWDGMGIEIGASALDHDGNTDPYVPVAEPLQPKEKQTNYILIEVIDKETSKNLAKEFSTYSKEG